MVARALKPALLSGPCTWSGCANRSRQWGLCVMHRDQVRTYPGELKARFIAKYQALYRARQAERLPAMTSALLAVKGLPLSIALPLADLARHDPGEAQRLADAYKAAADTERPAIYFEAEDLLQRYQSTLPKREKY